MGFKEVLAGTNRRDELTNGAIADARRFANQGLNEFTVSVHSTYGGSALLPRLVPHVVKELQNAGFQVVGVEQNDWAYTAHISIRR